LHRDLNRLRVRHALVGGLAVASYGSTRATHDADFAVAVADDREAEELVRALAPARWQPAEHIEHASGRLSGVRLTHPALPERLRADLLFAASGIEAEVVAGAQEQVVWQGLTLPVASRHHLVSMKILSMSDLRSHDADDLRVLIQQMPPSEIELAREAVALVMRRGFAPGRDLLAEFERFRSSNPSG
jgi:hypothetical protein